MSSDLQLTKCFAVLSGNEPSLAKAEVESLLHLANSETKAVPNNRIVFFDIAKSNLPFLLSRAAMIKEAGHIIGESSGFDEDLGWISDAALASNIKKSETFCVRTLSFVAEGMNEYRSKITNLLGAKIQHITKARVNAKQPDAKILVLLTRDGIKIGRSYESATRRKLTNKNPSELPFFHPSMMNAQLARVMCNLAWVLPEQIAYDPFSGGGGILLELASLGAKTIGMDLSWRQLMGSRANLTHEKLPIFTLIQGNARSPPIGKHFCDSIVTDPPYGRASSTRGAEATELVTEFLIAAAEILKPNGRLCIAGSSLMGIPEITKDLGLNCTCHIPIRVHSGLIRDIVTVKV